MRSMSAGVVKIGFCNGDVGKWDVLLMLSNDIDLSQGKSINRFIQEI